MSKSAIYTANTSGATISVNSIIPVGSIIRRFGCNITSDGNSITVTGCGYYKVTASATLAPTAPGIATVTGYTDGVPYTGATASETATAANDNVSMPVVFEVRNFNQCDSTKISFQLSGTESVIENFSVTVEKL